MGPAVSVVLPFHNAAATLPAALASIAAQTWTDWELVAVDDGSTDAGPALVARLAQGDARIRLIQPGRVGIVAALQAGCAAARAPLIARMDADDVSHKDRLALQSQALAAHPRWGLCGCRVVAGGPVRSGRARYLAWINALTDPAALVREIFVECPVAHPSFLLRRTALEAVGGYQDRGWAEDYDLVLRLWRGGWELGKVDAPLLTWTERPGRLSMTDARYAPEAFRACKRHHLRQTLIPPGCAFYQWGAGLVGKPWLREWGADGPQAVVDIRPGKVGQRIHGVPVIPPEGLPPPGRSVVLVTVGTPGAREVIRAWLCPRGHVEGSDFVFLA
jgi:cellulose synthase/poly-beta-1,6-N-acetylglucosamine synthase-like glycosyltransferase